MRKVFIPSLPTRYDAATQTRVPSLDLNPAAQYGELISITGNSTERPDLQRGIEEIRAATPQINTEDLVLCVGDVILAAAAIALVSRQNGVANVLRWSKPNHSYTIERVVI